MSTHPLLTIGTRGSPLALVQAHLVRDRLAAAHPELAEAGAVAIQVIRTTGDRVTDRTLAEIGGKGLFTKEIEEALLAGAVDLAVHSMKDVPTWLPFGLEIACILPRADARDVLIGQGPQAAIDDLPTGAVIGTASLRRQAQLLFRRPDLVVVPLRGNVGTRLAKVREGAVHATLLAAAGLLRLGLDAQMEDAWSVLSPEEMLPAVAQGAIGLEIRSGDARTAGYVQPLDDPPTAMAVAAERALLTVLDGSCRTPIAAFARIDPAGAAGSGTLTLCGRIVRPDGSERHEVVRSGPAAQAVLLGEEAGRDLRGKAGPGFFDGPGLSSSPDLSNDPESVSRGQERERPA